MDTTKRRREAMVAQQIAARGVHDARVLEAMRLVPREEFVDPALRDRAYDDSPLPIEEGQTISQPYIVALMVEAAEIRPNDKVLEIGAGSGYAAAVLGAVAGHVHAIERHPSLALRARERLERLGYRNVEVRAGDGSGGWPEAAPFDAILGAAGSPQVPDVLLQQLAIGGRLVLPVGERVAGQRLVKVVRTGEHTFERQDLGGVRFVPLVGRHGWTDDAASAPAPVREPTLVERLRAAVEPLPDIDDPAFGECIDRFADARVVALGEASHGTSEFYRARAAITRRLIEAHGFNLVAVEADWPDAASIDRVVRQRPRPTDAAPAFQRFPTWMWRNTDVEAFVAWLRAHNATVADPARRVGFHGLDIYSLGASMRAVIDYLDTVDPALAAEARRRYGCLAPWADDPAHYGRQAFASGYARCEAPVLAMLGDLLGKRLAYAAADPDAFLDATQNARLVASAEEYYRTMYHGAAASWNLRDTHMAQTLGHLLDSRPGAKAVVWAHNSHIGDARATDMGRTRGELNLGQLCRQRYGSQARLVGFGTHAGTVAAASDWDEPMQVMHVRPSLPDSIERASHDAGMERWLLDLATPRDPVLAQALDSPPRLERYIGVIYRPETERWSHYSPASLAQQYDAWIWFDRTRAVTPLTRDVGADTSADDTWPFGL